MSIYKGNNLISGAMPNSANQSLSNLNSAGQDKFDAKADVDLANVTDTGYIKMAGAGMPSNKYINLTLGASGSTYIAPANGWYNISKQAGNPGFNPYIALINTTAGGLSTEARPGAQGKITIQLFLPAKKGDVIRVNYDATGNTDKFRFIYAQGSKSEA